MQLNFEQQKNLKASLYTSLICGLLALLFFVTQWKQTPPVITPPEPSYMEVNLGNSETGQGDTPPLSKEAPAPEVGASKQVKATAAVNATKVISNSNDANDEAIKSSKATKQNKTMPLPPAPKPKALMGKYAGGNGKGGNNQDSYNNVKDQGIAGGQGDQGVANGSINGKSYTGSGGPFVTKGDRHVTKVYSFNGDVEAATIYAEIEVSPTGSGRFIQIVKGSSSNDIKYKKAITEYLTKISFNTADHSSIVTVKFKFEVQ
ncbi:MAG: hypothetical protein RL377_1403 [Bacteroidota bacterium]|jgi:hypothetical protein